MIIRSDVRNSVRHISENLASATGAITNRIPRWLRAMDSLRQTIGTAA
jgi:hypothetical protein